MDTGERSPTEEVLAAHIGATNPTAASGETSAQLDRFSQKTRQILASAAEQARLLGHAEIRPEHLMLALLLEPGTEILRPLRAAAGRVDLADLRETLVGRLQAIDRSGLTGLAEPSGLSDGCKRVLQEALAEAQRLDSPEVGPAHLLYGLVGEGSALAGSVVTALALRGLRVSLSARAWRSSSFGSTYVVDAAERGFRVAPGQPGAQSTSTRDHVITFRVADAELAAIDTLVDSGAMKTRSEASAWLLKSGIAANKEYFEEIQRIGEEIARLRQEVQRLTDAHIGRAAASQEHAGTNPEEPASEPPRSEQSA